MRRFCNTFTIQFYCRKTKVNKTGYAPVEMGVNYQGERFFLNTSYKAVPATFNKEMGPRSNSELKAHLGALERRIRAYETECLEDGDALTIQGLKDYIRNGYQKPGKTIGDLFKGFLERLGKKANQDVMQKYQRVITLFTEECALDPRKPAASITVGMVSAMCERIDSRFKNSSAAGIKARLKCVLRYGLDNGYYAINPFQEKIIKKEVPVVALTQEEVDRIREKDLSELPRLARVRDLFIFSCYTGLAYCDTQKLTREDVMEKDGTYYLEKERAKTGVKYTVVLLPEALDILRKYDWVLPRISNQKLNSYLYEIETLCRIGKRLHFHLARHTAACMFLNKFRFKTEVTAKILGHASIRVTQHYQKIFSNTVFDAFKEIK